MHRLRRHVLATYLLCSSAYIHTYVHINLWPTFSCLSRTGDLLLLLLFLLHSCFHITTKMCIWPNYKTKHVAIARMRAYIHAAVELLLLLMQCWHSEGQCVARYNAYTYKPFTFPLFDLWVAVLCSYLKFCAKLYKHTCIYYMYIQYEARKHGIM